jgi:hypothetical protein
LEIDKILIRYFSSQTVTAQKLLYLTVGIDFAYQIFSIFSNDINSSCIKSSAPHITCLNALGRTRKPAPKKNHNKLKKSKSLSLMPLTGESL